VFERFTEQARQVVVLAQEQSRSLGHDYIGTEHILIGLATVEPGVGDVLRAAGLPADRVRDEVAARVGTGDPAQVHGQIPFTPRAKRTLELALREALTLGHRHIGPEHILLGLLRDADGVEGQILADAGTTTEELRDTVLATLPATAPAHAHGSGHAYTALRAPVDLAWLIGPGLSSVLGSLAREVRHELGRDPDAGDLLLVLALVPDTVAAEALRELGVEPDALQATVERRRSERERLVAPLAPDVLAAIRKHLGLPDPPP
jgi:ATP-dependent Clp protease ATP-binding subunit ClpA